MLLQADAKQLEWIGAAYLSKDKVAFKEIWDSVDQHSDNQERFGLPSRLIAKTFVFRLIYGGSAYSYANDPNFKDIGNSDFWQHVIEEFYLKYPELYKWHQDIYTEAVRNGKLVMPTGREYYFEPEIQGFGSNAKMVHPRTKILNYPVQGLGADLMAIARVSLYNRLKENKNVKFVNTVHDSIILDFDEKVCDTNELVKLVDKCFNDVPSNFERMFKVKFNLPMRVECQVGPDWKNMEVVNAN